MSWQNDQRARISTFPEAVRTAHAHCSRRRKKILSSTSCGCFYCRAIFSQREIKDWVDEGSAGEGQTALCAGCVASIEVECRFRQPSLLFV
jgi:hypothetical protein